MITFYRDKSLSPCGQCHRDGWSYRSNEGTEFHFCALGTAINYARYRRHLKRGDEYRIYNGICAPFIDKIRKVV